MASFSCSASTVWPRSVNARWRALAQEPRSPFSVQTAVSTARIAWQTSFRCSGSVTRSDTTWAKTFPRKSGIPNNSVAHQTTPVFTVSDTFSSPVATAATLDGCVGATCSSHSLARSTTSFAYASGEPVTAVDHGYRERAA